MSTQFGIGIVMNRLPDMDRSLRSKAGRFVQELAEDIADLAQQLAPVDTGALKASIEPNKIDAYHWEVTAGNEAVDYAGFVENGTTRAPSQPFLTPAADAHKERYFAGIRRILNEAASGE